MTKEEFRKLNNFHEQETDIYKRLLTSNLKGISSILMRKMDDAITVAKEYFNYARGQFIVHDINLGNHSGKSLHYEGKAIDGHFIGLNLYETVMIGFKAGFNGIGYYPHWKNKGIHFDIRKQNHVSTWLCIDGKYIYDFDTFLERLLIESEV